MEFRNKYIFGKIIFYLTVFTFFRLLLYVLYNDYFGALTSTQVFTAFIDGLRFDISIILTFIGLPLFLMNLPVNNKLWLKAITVIASIEFLAMVLLLTGDVLYFDIVKRHLGDDLLLAIDDTDFVMYFAIKQYWYILFVVIVLFALYIRFLFSIINRHFEKRKIKPVKEIIFQIIAILLIIIGIRGTFGDMPINIINAFGGGSSEYGNLTLNGVFSVYHITRNADNVNHNFYHKEKALKSIFIDYRT